MTFDPNKGLRIPTQAELDNAVATMRVCAIDGKEVPGWEDGLREYGETLIKTLAVELQDQNDCNANSGATGEEGRRFFCTGEMVQLARTYLYNACEYVSGESNVGRDAGTSIQSAVEVLVNGIKKLGVAPGLPLESDYKYMTYERSSSRFAERAKGVQIDKTFVAQHGPAPSLDDLPLHCALGGSVHFGVYWGVRFETRVIGGRKFKTWVTTSGGGGGHALEIVTCLWLDGKWWPAGWNSHGDGLFIMLPEIYTRYQKTQFAPFGGYGLLPDKPVERYYDCRLSGGGLFPKNYA